MTSDWKDTSGVVTESEPPTLTDAEVLGQLRVLLVDDDLERGRSFLARTREIGVTARLATPDGRGLVDAAPLDPEVVLLLGATAARAPSATSHLAGHPRLRWASVIDAAAEPDFPSPLDDDFPARLAAVVRGHVAADRRLERLARTRRQFAARIDSIGPSRTLRALARSEGCLRLTVSSPQALSEIDLSDGLIAGATWIELIDGTPRELVGPTALSALLELDAGLVFVERRARPELLDIMVPADEALANATIALGEEAATSPDALELPDADPAPEVAMPHDVAAAPAATTAAARVAPEPEDAATQTIEMEPDWTPFGDEPGTGVEEATSVEPEDDDTPTMRPAPGEAPDDLFDESLRSAVLRAPSIPPSDSLVPPPLEADAPAEVGAAQAPDDDVTGSDALDRESADLVAEVHSIDEPGTRRTGASRRVARADAGETTTASRPFATQKAFPPPGVPTASDDEGPTPLPEPFARRPASTLEAFRFPREATEAPVPDRGNDPRREPDAGLGAGTAGYDVDREVAAAAQREARASRGPEDTTGEAIPSVQETMRVIPEGSRGPDERPTRPEKPSAIPAPRLRRDDLPGAQEPAGVAPPTATPTAVGPLQDETGTAATEDAHRAGGELGAEPTATEPVASVVPARYVPTDPPVVASARPAGAGTGDAGPTASAEPPPPARIEDAAARRDAARPTPTTPDGARPPRLLWVSAAAAAAGLLALGTALWLQRGGDAVATETVTPESRAAPTPARAPAGTNARQAAPAAAAGEPGEPAATAPSEVAGAGTEAEAGDLAPEVAGDTTAAGDDDTTADDTTADDTATAAPAGDEATAATVATAQVPEGDAAAAGAGTPDVLPEPAPEAAATTAEEPERDQAASDARVAEARDLFLDGANPGRVQALLDEALLHDDRNPRAEQLYAELLLGQGRAAEAEERARRAVDLRRRRASYRVLLGDTLAAQGKHEEARRAYREALELDPDDPVAAQRVRR